MKGVSSHKLRQEFHSLKTRSPTLWITGGAPIEQIKVYTGEILVSILILSCDCDKISCEYEQNEALDASHKRAIGQADKRQGLDCR